MKTMTFRAFLLFSVVTSLLICGCSNTNTVSYSLTDTDKTAIEAVVQKYVSATLSNDCLALAALFTEDGVQIPPDVPPQHSRKAIEDWCSEEDIKISDLVMLIDDIEGCTDIAWLGGSYRFQFIDLVKGNYVMTFQRQPDDSWQIKTLIWTNLAK